MKVTKWPSSPTSAQTPRSAAQLHDVAADVDALILWIGIHQTGVIEDEHVGMKRSVSSQSNGMIERCHRCGWQVLQRRSL
jgi:hypothetical protein